MNLAQIVKQLWNEDGPMIAAGDNVADGLQRLCARCYEALPSPVWNEMFELAAVEGDEREFQTWLTDTLRDFPPSHNLKMLWFGIVEDLGLDDMDGEPTGEDMDNPAGADDDWFDDIGLDENGDDLLPTTAFVYVCGDRYLFTEPRPVERQKGYSYDPPGQQFFPQVIELYYHKFFGEDEDLDTLATSYLIPAYTGLLISSACRRLDPQLLTGPAPARQVVFGWDEGEPIVLGGITREGWRPRYQPVKF